MLNQEMFDSLEMIPTFPLCVVSAFPITEPMDMGTIDFGEDDDFDGDGDFDEDDFEDDFDEDDFDDDFDEDDFDEDDLEDEF